MWVDFAMETFNRMWIGKCLCFQSGCLTSPANLSWGKIWMGLKKSDTTHQQQGEGTSASNRSYSSLTQPHFLPLLHSLMVFHNQMQPWNWSTTSSYKGRQAGFMDISDKTPTHFRTRTSPAVWKVYHRSWILYRFSKRMTWAEQSFRLCLTWDSFGATQLLSLSTSIHRMAVSLLKLFAP